MVKLHIQKYHETFKKKKMAIKKIIIINYSNIISVNS